MTYLSSKLKELREKNNVSQYKLAEDLNIKRSAYGNYETGMSYPEYEILEKISVYFNTDINELLGYDSDFDGSLNLLTESEAIKNQIKRYFYRKYRKVPNNATLNKIIGKLLEK